MHQGESCRRQADHVPRGIETAVEAVKATSSWHFVFGRQAEQFPWRSETVAEETWQDLTHDRRQADPRS